MNTREKTLLNRAIEISKQSSCAQKHGVVIASGRRILAVAVNTDRNNPNICSEPKTEASFHAEWNAIKQILDSNSFASMTVYSARTNRKGEPLPAKPCRRCLSMILGMNFKKVIHT